MARLISLVWDERFAATCGDWRAVIRATPKGTRILQEGRRRRVAALAGELEGLSAAELTLLLRAAETMGRVAGRPATT
jgi:hypothetical protein